MSDETTNNGTNEPVAEEPVAGGDDAKESADSVKSKISSKAEAASKTINEAFKQVEKQVEQISKTLGSALQDRANVVMVRVNDDSLAYLDMLVEADITKSRSESAAFLINEGIKSNETLFNRIRQITDQIAVLKSQLRETVKVE
jgi:uncharacterized FlaG/YvyC family protein